MEVSLNTVVLMYHGLYRDQQELQQMIDAEDRHYAVSLADFRRHLQLIRASTCKSGTPDVVLTFDDGHLSNHTLALPELLSEGLNAWFFVTTDFMASRQYFCRPQQVKELHDAGMLVGSHGKSHRFFSDLSIQQQKQELEMSRQALEETVQAPVTSISFPGGRYNSDTLELASATGYTLLFDSRTGINQGLDLAACGNTVMRVAVRKTTSDVELNKIITGDNSYYAKAAIKQSIKSGLRTLLGNRLYHGFYKSVTG